MEIPKEVQQDLIQLQSLQQQLELLISQRRLYEMEVVQIDQTLSELEKVDGEVYQNLGFVLIKKSKEDVKRELNRRRDELKSKIDVMKNQEQRVRSKLEDIKKKIEEKMGKGKAK